MATTIITNPDGTTQIIVTADPPSVVKVTQLTYDEFRKTMTVTELTLIDSAHDDAYLTAVGKTPLTVTQKATVRYLISEAQATGAGMVGINLTSPKMGAAIDAMIALGLIEANRKLEIVAGTVKS